MDESNTGYGTELRHAIVQKVNGTLVPESVIARFQHEGLAIQFLGAITAISGHVLHLEELHGR